MYLPLCQGWSQTFADARHKYTGLDSVGIREHGLVVHKIVHFFGLCTLVLCVCVCVTMCVGGVPVGVCMYVSVFVYIYIYIYIYI